MTLRARLLLVLAGVVTLGLFISDAVTYTQLRSYLIARIDPQLQAASYAVARQELEGLLGISPTIPPNRNTGTTRLPPDLFPRPGVRSGGRQRFGLAPTDTVGELINDKGALVGKPLPAFFGEKVATPPVLPHPLPSFGKSHSVLFAASSRGKNATDYQVLARSLNYHGLIVIVAIPLTDVAQTLGRLLLIELLVSVGVLVGLGVLSWLIVRRGLRPLEEMAVTAGEIAGGDLAQRVAPAEERTEVGRLGLALNAMLGEIEVAFEARAASEDRLRQFLADASHELRTPLTSIRGYAELFELGAKDRPADLETSMRHIREEAERMHVMVDDLLLLARLDQERPLEVERDDLVAVLASAVAAATPTTSHPVHLETPPEIYAFFDRDRIRQIVDNLLSNALRNSPDGAPVELRAVAGEGVTVEVIDHGPGVDPEESARIFEPFYRSDYSRAREVGGAGLGLSIVAAIARAHGGSVGVRPTPGGGATFWLTLPSTPRFTGNQQNVESTVTSPVD